MGNKEHAHMPPSQRAKQFLPFDAVAGLREALRAKEHEMGFAIYCNCPDGRHRLKSRKVSRAYRRKHG